MNIRQLPATLTMEEVLEAAQESEGDGFCLSCGNRQSWVEPDARNYECEVCHALDVYGAEQIILEII